jgi:hypothetical protein
MNRKKLTYEYIPIAVATVIFWRGSWNLIDRLPYAGSIWFDALSVLVALGIIWIVARSFKHLD